METFFPLPTGMKRKKCFNRTMQYGNEQGFFRKKPLHFCLNRTMQYGNCPHSHFLSSSFSGLNRTMQYGNNKKRKRHRKIKKFKSYYVVWKLPVPNVFLTSSAVFKSYYVVWKLHSETTPRTSYTGLNRTMQYGNLTTILLQI